MKKNILCANWKMNKTYSEAQAYFKELLSLDLPSDQVEVVVAVPDLFAKLALDECKETDIKVGVQNAYPEESGSFTGETSVYALADMGIDYVIVGHSERREIFKESDAFINEKVSAVFEQGMIPILCVGETLEQKENGETIKVVNEQIEKALSGVPADSIPQLVVGYEPVWAIGTGKTASEEEAQEAAAAIRQKIAELYSQEAADQLRIQYGGSANPDNIGSFLSQEDIDGGLIGGAGLEAVSFAQMIRVASDHD